MYSDGLNGDYDCDAIKYLHCIYFDKLRSIFYNTKK